MKPALLAIIGAVTLQTAALAATEMSIHDLPDKGNVIVSGTVEKVKNSQEFTLRDNSGSIDVKAASADRTLLPKKGDNVVVAGLVEKRLWGLMGKDINASSVEVKQASSVPSDPNGTNQWQGQ